MSKILKSFGMAVLLAALLAGTGMAATTAGVEVTGEVEDMVLTISTTPSPVAFDPLIKGTTVTETQTNGIGLTTNVPWKLALTDDNTGGNAGKMRKGSGDPWTYDSSPEVPLTNALVVTLDPEGTPVVLTTSDATGASTSSSQVLSDLKYEQIVASGDTIGLYKIEMTYTLSYNP